MLVTTKQIKNAFGTRGKDFFKSLFGENKEIDLTPELIAPAIKAMGTFGDCTGFSGYIQVAKKLKATDRQISQIRQLSRDFQNKFEKLQDEDEDLHLEERFIAQARYQVYFDLYYELTSKTELIYRSIRDFEIHSALNDFWMTELHAPATNKHARYLSKQNRCDIAHNTYFFNINVAGDMIKEITIESPAAKELQAERQRQYEQRDRDGWNATEPLRNATINTLAQIFYEIITSQIV